MVTKKSNIEYGAGRMRQRSDIYQASVGYLNKIEKNAAGDTVRITQYDSPVYLRVALTQKGNINCAANPNYPIGVAGDVYIVSVSGKIGGALGTAVNAGDTIVCINNAPTGTEAIVGNNWEAHTGYDIIIDPISGSNFNMFYVGDTIALREEDGTAEPLGTTKEEFLTITAIDQDLFTITVSTDAMNNYTIADCYVYTVKNTEKYLSGFDKVVTSTEIWKNN